MDISRRFNIPMLSDSENATVEPGHVVIEIDTSGTFLRLSSWEPRSRWAPDLSSGKLGYRQAQHRATSELLRKATGNQGGRQYSLLDATAGAGTDAVMLAALGFEVTALERHAVLALMLDEALARARTDAGAPESLSDLRFVHADAIAWMQSSTEPFDVIYLDPMFPDRTKSAQVKKPMQILQALHQDETDDTDVLLDLALQNAKYRVVVKRPARAPFLADRKPTHQVKGSNIRFDIYGIRSMRPAIETN